MKTRILLLAGLLLSGAWANAQTTTAFTYQGILNTNGSPVTGAYDLEFSLFDNSTNGNLIAGPITNLLTDVSNGAFTAQLDFGASAFAGSPRWLQVGVRAGTSTNGSTNTFTELTPLQLITATPYAITAINLSGPLQATNLIGTLSSSNLPASIVLNQGSNLVLSGSFSGDGGGLTNITAASLTGIIPSASLPAGVITNLPAGIITNLPLGLITNSQANITLTGTFIGNGAGLTNLSLSVPGVITNTATGVSLGGTFSGFFSGNGSGLNTINAGTLVGSVPASSLSSVPGANLTGTIPASTLAGVSGAGLINLNASELTSGTIPLSALPGTIVSNINGLTSVSNFYVLETNVVNDLIVTNSALFSNTVVIITNTGGASVTFSNGAVLASGDITNAGNLTVGGVITGDGSGLTGLVSPSTLNSSNLLLISDIVATNEAATNLIAAAIVIASNNVILQSSNALYAASNSILLGASNSVLVASNTVLTAASNLVNAASNSVLLGASNSVYVASNTVELALLSAGTAITNVVAPTITEVAGATPNDVPFALVARDLSGGAAVSTLTATAVTDNGSLSAEGITDTGSLTTGSTGQLTVNTTGDLSTSGTLSAHGITDTGSTTTVNGLGALTVSASVSVTAPNFVGSGTAPTIAYSDVGDNGSASIAGTDSSGQITITTGDNPSAGGVTIVTVSFSTHYPSTSYPVITPAEANSSTLPNTGFTPYVSGTADGFTISAPSGFGLNSDVQYKFNYIVIGK